MEGIGVTATTGKQELLQSNLSWNDWATTSPRITTGKKVLKVAPLPCHNLGGAGIVAEVVCSAPWREGAPAITHQEVPNQLRRDAHRLHCTFLLFFSSKEIAGPQYQWTRTFFLESHAGDYIGGEKKKSPTDFPGFISGKSPFHSSCSQMTSKLSVIRSE